MPVVLRSSRGSSRHIALNQGETYFEVERMILRGKGKERRHAVLVFAVSSGDRIPGYGKKLLALLPWGRNGGKRRPCWWGGVFFISLPPSRSGMSPPSPESLFDIDWWLVRR
jgi:hypothetical protein